MTCQCFLFAMDITSLYTVIPNNSGCEPLAYFLGKRPVLNPLTSALMRLAKLVLTINAFTFNGRFHKQIDRIIGKNFPAKSFIQINNTFVFRSKILSIIFLRACIHPCNFGRHLSPIHSDWFIKSEVALWTKLRK